jgi:hypothetical protein
MRGSRCAIAAPWRCNWARVRESARVAGLPWKIRLPVHGSTPEREAPIASWAGRLLRTWLDTRCALQIEAQALLPAARCGWPWGKVAQHGAAKAVLAAAGIPEGGGGSFKGRIWLLTTAVCKTMSGWRPSTSDAAKSATGAPSSGRVNVVPQGVGPPCRPPVAPTPSTASVASQPPSGCLRMKATPSGTPQVLIHSRQFRSRQFRCPQFRSSTQAEAAQDPRKRVAAPH